MIDEDVRINLVCEPGLWLDLKHHNNTPRLLLINRATIFMPEKYISLVIKVKKGGWEAFKKCVLCEEKLLAPKAW
jgi:hypothetical protein